MAGPMLQEDVKTICQLLPPQRLNYSRLYLDFVTGRRPADDFYPAKSLDEVAARLDRRTYDRATLISILRRQNSAYQASSATFENIEKLTDRRAVCLFAGQQAGLFGGPILTLLKALAVVKAAGQYGKSLERPVIPVFWIAGDDHDFEEANHTCVLDRQGEIVPLAYQTPPAYPVSAGEIYLHDAAELGRVKEQLKTSLGQGDFTADLSDLIDRTYTPEDTLVSSFGKLMAALAADSGLVLFSPADPEAKKLAQPFFLQALELQNEIRDTLLVTNERIKASGYHIQVEKKEESTHLFYSDNGRSPVIRQGDNFVIGDKTCSRSELTALIDKHPEKFSPDVMLRPLMQSFLFPVLSQKGGPSEVAYFAQLNPLFPLFDLPGPVQKARATLTLVETRSAQHMEEMDLTFDDMLGDIEQVVNRVLARSFPDYLEADFNALRETLDRQFRKFRDEALDFEPGLKAYAEQTMGKIDYTLKNFESKVFSAHKKKSQQTRERIYRLQHALYPQHGLQERTLNVFSFLSRYGPGLVQYVLNNLDPETPEHQLLCLSEYRT